MKLFLFGGAEGTLGHAPILKEQIKKVIVDLHPQCVLHIPFARLNPNDENWLEGWFKEIMSDTDIRVLDARIQTDIDNAKNPLIFINGGYGKTELMNAINSNKKLKDLIFNSEFIIGESAGSLIIGELLRATREDNTMIKGLGILKNTIIEGHYTELNRRELLISEMKENKMKYGIGIDCVTGFVVDTNEFPKNYEKIGLGNVELIID